MKWRSIVFYGLLVAMSFYSMQSCQCNREDVKPDPCAGYVAEKPDITMQIHIGDVEGYGLPDFEFLAEPHGLKWNYYLDVDTIADWTTVIFNTTREYDEYHWKIGDHTNVIEKDIRNFGLRFLIDANQAPYRVEVEFIGKRYSECESSSVITDTISKHLFVVRPSVLSKSPALYGQFRGVNENALLDTFTVTVDTMSTPFESNNPYFRFAGFPCQDTGKVFHEIIYIWKTIIFTNANYIGLNPGVGAMLGVARYSDNYDTLTVKYYYNEDPYDFYATRHFTTFKGIKVKN